MCGGQALERTHVDVVEIPPVELHVLDFADERFDDVPAEIHLLETLGAPEATGTEDVDLHQFVTHDIQAHQKHPILDEFWANDLRDSQVFLGDLGFGLLTAGVDIRPHVATGSHPSKRRVLPLHSEWASIHDEEGEYNQSISYFLVPALARYKFDNHMYAEIGPQFGLAYKAHIKFHSKIDGTEINASEENRDMINRFDMGLAAGAGYRLLKGLGWTIGVRYYYGFFDVYKDRSGTNNSSLFLKLNVPIGLSDVKKEEIKKLKNQKAEKKAKKKEEKKALKNDKKENKKPL